MTWRSGRNAYFEFTIRNMQTKDAHAGVWGASDIEIVMQNLKQKLQEGSVNLSRAFRKFDTDKSQVSLWLALRHSDSLLWAPMLVPQTITYDEFNEMLRHYGMEISTTDVRWSISLGSVKPNLMCSTNTVVGHDLSSL